MARNCWNSTGRKEWDQRMLDVFSGPDFSKISLKKQTSIRKCQDLQKPQGISTMPRRFSETGFIFPG